MDIDLIVPIINSQHSYSHIENALFLRMEIEVHKSYICTQKYLEYT